MLTAGAAMALALSCAPNVSPDTLLSVAYVESRWEPLAIHDNATGDSIHPATATDAARIASRMIADGHRPDLGLLQINSVNLASTGLTVQTAFDPCASMRAGAQILAHAYSGGATMAQQQVALIGALSAYNTGSETAGLRTYAPLVLASARKVVPALRIAGLAPLQPPAVRRSGPASTPGPSATTPDPFVNPAQSDANLSFPVQQEAKP